MKSLKNVIFVGFSFFLFLSCAEVNIAVKNPNLTDKSDLILAGMVKAAFGSYLSPKLSKFEIDVVFYPEMNISALEFRHEFTKYRLFFSESVRQDFIKGVNLYKKGFETRTLLKKNKKTRAIFGKNKSYLEWETFKTAKTYISRPEIKIGYQFKGETPFFTVFIGCAKEKNRNLDNAKSLKSEQINMYFSRSQADNLARLLINN